MRFRTVTATVVGLAMSAVLLSSAPASSSTLDAPVTVPALQKWTAGTGSFQLKASSRLLVDAQHASALTTTALTFLDDLRQITRPPMFGVGQPNTVRPGDLFLTLAPFDESLGSEGYRIEVSSVIKVTAKTDTGVFYGTRTLLQLLRQGPVPGGVAEDWPTYPERGLMVDVGRKYFTVGWLRAHIKELAYLKLNYFHLHLSDNLGFRLESSSHPEVVSQQHYTKQEITELIALAARYKVQIVPEIDAPGHMDQILASHPDLKLVRDDGTIHNGFIDLSKPAAYQLIEDLVTEYLPLFPSRYWHIGADEYVSGGSGGGSYDRYPQLLEYARANYGPDAIAKDTFYGYINWINDIIRSHGKTTRMWNDDYRTDGSTIRPASNIIVEHWYNRANPRALSPQQIADAGHLVMNGHYTQTYHVLGSSRKPNMAPLYQSWNVNSFHGNLSLAPTSIGSHLGAKIHVWCDQPARQTEEQVASGIRDPLRVLAQHTWNSPKPVASYADYQHLMALVGRSPGWKYDTVAGNLAVNRPVTVSSQENSDLVASGATDGSYASRWSSVRADPQWISIDLGSVRDVTRVKLSWEGAYAKSYEIQMSNDGTLWTTVYATTTGDGAVDDITGLTASGRYIRMHGLERGSRWGYSLYEIEVYA
ncbi:MAG TPA: beta-N-acetylhexosaminidase [Micromonosporaceae bacterium]|nr:beta-N-acetylhexosaminidase [Micromonosporaceae bacterium]